MRSYQPVHQQNTIEEISQRAKGTYDTSALIEKRLGNIESKFQGLEDRVIKIEATLREVRADAYSQKDDHKDFRYGTKTSFDADFNKRLVALELKVQENNPYGSKSTYKTSEDTHASELKALTKLVQSLQESQANLQAELTAIKKTQTNNQDNKFDSRQPSGSGKHHLQSPLKVRFAQEPTDSEEDKKYRGKKQDDSVSQVSPYSPPRQKEYSKSYQDLDSIIAKRDNGGEKKDLSKPSPYSNIAISDSLAKKYDLVRSDSAKRDSYSIKNASDSEFGKKSFSATDGFGHSFKPKAYGDDLEFDRRKITHDLPSETPKKTDISSSSQMNFKRSDYQQQAPIPSWSKSDYLGSIESAVQQAKAKNIEDIDRFKKTLNRESEDRFGTRERPRTALDHYSQSGDEKSLIKLQSAMPQNKTPERFGNQFGTESHQGSGHGAPRTTYSDHKEQPGLKQDNSGKETDDKTMRVSAYLGERSRVRSISMYDARPLVEKTEVKQQLERSDNRISEEKRKQIEQDIERKIRDETERRRRENMTRGSGDHTVEQSRSRNVDESRKARDLEIPRPNYLSKEPKTYAY